MHLNPESLSFALLISDLGSIARAANTRRTQDTVQRDRSAWEGRGTRLPEGERTRDLEVR